VVLVTSDSPFRDLHCTFRGIRVSFEDIGEGWNGDYDPEDPTDEPLLRFTVTDTSEPNEVEPRSVSWCTAVNARQVKRRRLRGFAKAMAREFHEDMDSWKGLAAYWSHLTTDEVNSTPFWWRSRAWGRTR
jgi:hypothetical protein